MNNAEVRAQPDGASFAGHIHMVRHGEPDLSRAVWLSRQGFNAWWIEYGRVGLSPSALPPVPLMEIAAKAAVVVASPVRRARATAERLIEKSGATLEIIVDEIYEEMPLPAPMLLPFLRLPPPLWGTVARFAWWLGYADGGESRYEAEERARKAADRLIELAADSDGDVVLCGHGWFIHMAAKELKRRGWSKVKGGGATFWDHKSFASPV